MWLLTFSFSVGKKRAKGKKEEKKQGRKNLDRSAPPTAGGKMIPCSGLGGQTTALIGWPSWGKPK